MTCEDCLHWEACRNLIEAMNPDYKGKNITIRSVCKVFKNKADYAEVKHGEWKKEKLDMCEPYYLCSICGKLHDQEYLYCNECGAIMDKNKLGTVNVKLTDPDDKLKSEVSTNI